MFDPSNPASPNFHITLRPKDNHCELVVSLSWDALELLLSSVAHRIEPAQRAEAERAAAWEQSRRETAQKVERSKLLGRQYLDAHASAKAQGLDNRAAWRAVAERYEVPLNQVHVFARLARRELRDCRDERIEDLARQGLSNAEIGREVGLSAAMIAKIIQKRLKSRASPPKPGPSAQVTPLRRARHD